MTEEKKQNLWLALYTVLTVVMYLAESQVVKGACLVFIFYTGAFVKGIQPGLLYMLSSIGFTFDNPIVFFAGTLPAYCNFNQLSLSVHRYFVPFCLMMLFSVFSFLTGVNSKFTTLIVFYVSVLVFMTLLSSSVSKMEFYKYVFCTFAAIVVILLIELQRGGLTIMYGRLAINDNIRELADLIAIPAFYSFASLADGYPKKKIIYIVVGVISSFILLLTISKGALISVVVSLACVFLIGKGKIINRLFFASVIFVGVYFVFQYALSLSDFHFERLEDEYDGFSGRTGIWLNFVELMLSSPFTVLFGFGPGDLRLISSDAMYAHSLFLDAFFSYGLFMTVLWFYLLIRIFKYVISAHSILALCLLIFTCLLYATHGVVTNAMFYILIAVSIVLSKNECDEQKVFE